MGISELQTFLYVLASRFAHPPDRSHRCPRLRQGTSAVRRFDYIVEAVRRAGPRKLLYGSDGPWLHPGVELHKIRLLGLRPEDEALVLGRNALHLMRNAREGLRSGRPARAESKPSVQVAAAAFRDQSLGPLEHEL